MKAIIQTHNRKILKQNNAVQPKQQCNCRIKSSCPVQGKCQVSGVYRGTIKTSNKTATYIGCSNNFKKRYNAHKNSFRQEKNMNATTLSTFVWDNGLNPEPEIKWDIIRTAAPYEPGRGNCQLCTQEKVEINSYASSANNLNKRTEIGQTCRHKVRFKLSNIP